MQPKAGIAEAQGRKKGKKSFRDTKVSKEKSEAIAQKSTLREKIKKIQRDARNRDKPTEQSNETSDPRNERKNKTRREG